MLNLLLSIILSFGDNGVSYLHFPFNYGSFVAILFRLKFYCLKVIGIIYIYKYVYIYIKIYLYLIFFFILEIFIYLLRIVYKL
jgi:hypothetical protein